MLEDLYLALLPFADLLEEPSDYPETHFYARVEVADIIKAREVLAAYDAQQSQHTSKDDTKLSFWERRLATQKAWITECIQKGSYTRANGAAVRKADHVELMRIRLEITKLTSKCSLSDT